LRAVRQGAGAVTTTIQKLAQAARLSGAAEVYDHARGELDDRDLGRLLLHLRRVDPAWRPPPKERRRLAARLLEAGVSDRDILDQTSISRTTLWRMRRDLVDLPNRARQPAFQSTGNVSNRAYATRTPSAPISSPNGVTASSRT
jgi:hypothetical protein